MQPIIFIDRDGVINVDREDYVKIWSEFIFLPNILESLKLLTDHHFRVIIITNQSAIGREIFSEDRLQQIHQKMITAVENAEGKIAAIYYCPHTPWDNCDCRKPAPGMFLQAAKEFDLDLSNSFFVGDAISDIQAGQNAGCQTVFVRTGKHRYEIDTSPIKPDYIFETLSEFVHFLIESKK